MKKINATTTYDPNLSTMQEIEYTMPQSKKDITNCLMNALDNLKVQQAEIDTKNGIIQLHQIIEAKHKAEIEKMKKWLYFLYIRYDVESEVIPVASSDMAKIRKLLDSI